jgi:hypothetical protein
MRLPNLIKKEPMPTCKLYVDCEGNTIKVATGSCRRAWASYRIKANGFLSRVKAKELPARSSQEDAQEDLARYATKNGWHSPD